jgi:D-alanyl-D-alanine carboxypeptidase (penicillin-binding protein 5/6)
VGQTEVSRGEVSTVEGVIKDNISLLGEKGISKDVERKVEFYSLIAPVSKGEKIGDIVYFKDGVEIARGDIIAKNDVTGIKLITIYKKLVDIWAKVGR